MGEVLKFNNKEEEIKTMSDVTYLKSLTGGKEPPADGNWLGTLINGSIFLVEGKQSREPALGQFILMEKTARSVCLMSPDAPGKQLWQNPHRFCGMYNLREVLGVVEIPEIPKEEEKNNEQGDRAEHPPEQTQ
jgi:hypothetical protein